MGNAARISANAAFDLETAAKRERDQAARRGTIEREQASRTRAVVRRDLASRAGDMIGIIIAGAMMLGVVWLMSLAVRLA